MSFFEFHSRFMQFVFLLGALVVPAFADPLVTHILHIKGHEVRAEVALTEQARLRGLMFRDSLPENGGMLFAYPRPEVSAMWMKNTKIPLAVAFIDAGGRILNIAEMEPLSEEPHASAGAAAYALEMNRGWFRRNGIKAGDRIEGLNKLPPAQ